jgi:peptide-methionine (S)-S-oxide reductase
LQATILTAVLLSSIFMAFNPSAMPSFLARFLRPFTSSTSLSLNPEPLSVQNFPENTQKATFASGCFWGVEHIFRKHYGNGKGLLDARVGYTGGGAVAPSYRAVCSGTTGHAESLLILFDPDKVSYKALVEFFFRTHDPTTKNRQGWDTGTQYRSAIFANSEEQLKIAQEAKAEVQGKWKYNEKGSTSTVSTEIEMAGPWYDAEDYHQLYLENNPGGYQCDKHEVRYGFPPLEGNERQPPG